jgi:small-conductance mechanosensitive channel
MDPSRLLISSSTLLALELGLWLLRRWFGVQARGFHHLWSLTLALYLGFGRFADSSNKLGALVLVLSAWVAFGLLDAAVLSRPRPSDGRPVLPALARDVAQLVLLLGVGLVALSWAFNVALETLLVSSTVLSAVLGLALQDVLKNLFAGIAMQMEGSPRPGDWLDIDGEPARVEELRWRTTRLRTNLAVDIYEPNSVLAQARLINRGSGDPPRAFDFSVGLPYEAPPAEVRKALLAAARSAKPVLDSPEPQVLLSRFGDSAIVYTLRVWARTVDRQAWLRDVVNSRIWYEINRAGLRVPFPIRTIHMHDSDREASEQRQREVERLARRLSRVSIFAQLDPETLEHLARHARRHFFDRGERLVSEGQTGSTMMVLLRGRAEVSRTPSDLSGEVRVAELTDNDYFGERVMLTGEPRSANVTAITGCEVLTLDRADLSPILEARPDLAEVLSHALAERIAETEAVVEAKSREMAKPSKRVVGETSEGLLERIRHLFRLPGSS